MRVATTARMPPARTSRSECCLMKTVERMIRAAQMTRKARRVRFAFLKNLDLRTETVMAAVLNTWMLGHTFVGVSMVQSERHILVKTL